MNSGHEEWDIVIIGAGMGGGTVGHALAQHGYRVLYLERGPKDLENRTTPGPFSSEDPEERLRNGRWPTRITTNVDGVTRRFFAPLGCAVGGSSLFYGATLERFERSDFEAEGAAGSGWTQWPISYDAFLPYYEQAEALYDVHGTPNPLDADDTGGALLKPEALTGNDASLFDSFVACGLNPYVAHLGSKSIPGCDQCAGRICERMCKSDTRRVCVLPALGTGRCEVLDFCEVTRLEADREAVRGVSCVRGGERLEIRARVFILSAGAYMSPRLLLRSRNEYWPQGVGNDRDQVGRYVMFHLMDMVAIWPRRKVKNSMPSKSICLRDFYRYEGNRFGLLQSMGVTADYGNILYALRMNLERSRLSGNRVLWHLLRIPAYATSRVLGHAAVFATVVEDMPYSENRIVLDEDEPSGIRVEYRKHPELCERGREMRRLIKRRLKGLRLMFLNKELELNFGHPCGSCRMGTDPATSVLDPSNRVHGLSNLYIVDSSFMPTSAGANPGLTIAANALRVGDIIHERLSKLSANRVRI